METYTTILVERSDNVATVTLNRPQVLNALNGAMISELAAAFRSLDSDDAVRAVVLTGTGERAFAAGADIGELHALEGAVQAARLSRRGQALTLQMERMRTPIVVAVNGFALGGGCELAMAGDIIIASDRARFGQPEINLGLIPGYGGTQRLSRFVGRGMAMFLCLSGDQVDAELALRIGLVQRVVPPQELREAAMTLAQTIATKAPLAVEAIKRAIIAGDALGLPDALAMEALTFASIVTTNDAREGTKAFLEKRPPAFSGH
ncbi:MAG: enoyl-CoA hydratase/isomerase family protein [Candidatus Eremiobacteraeota bacterium]|nr:enoyl-CoA hydratase/isomerase family protein [Candidatus Eremiobacteraeota bacterium]